MASYIRGNDNFDSGDLNAAPIYSSSTTSTAVGGYVNAYSNWPNNYRFPTLYSTSNAASANYKIYHYNGSSWVIDTVNYGTWIALGRDYGGYGVLVQRIA